MIEQIHYLMARLPESIPVATLFLGLLTALNPCQLAISMSALTFLTSKDEKKTAAWIRVIAYVLGRSCSYVLLCVGLKVIFLNTGSDTIATSWQSSAWVEWLDIVLPYLLILLGAFFLWRAFMPHHKHDSCHNSGLIIRRDGHLGAFFLGFLLALAFCPESAVFYFGGMVPMALSDTFGWAVPYIFALSAAVPVLVCGWLMIAAKEKMQRFSHLAGGVQRSVNVLFGILCIILSVWLLCAD